MQYKIFNSLHEDFLKIILPSLLIILIYFFPNSSSIGSLLALIAFFIDSGHIYTTYSESILDPIENKKFYVRYNILFAFFLNAIIFLVSKELFYNYIFYYTFYHHTKQGLGISLLYHSFINKEIFKTLYYILTLIPFVIFHFKENSINFSKIGLDNTLQKINLDFLNSFINLPILYLLFYITLSLCFIISLYGYIKYKNISSILIIFYGIVYYFALVYVNSPFFSYALMSISHGLVYIFLMEKRLKETHSLVFFKKHSLYILSFFILLGILIEPNQKLITFNNQLITALFNAMLWTPTIAHYTLDSKLWNYNNKKFIKMFKRNN